MKSFTLSISNTALADTLKTIEQVNPGDLMTSVQVLFKGMFGIFLFMLMFYLLIYGLEKVFTVKSTNEE